MPRPIPTSAYALTDQGKLDEAVAAYRQAIRIKPDYAEAHSNLLFSLNYMTNRRPIAFSPRTENGTNDMAGRYRGRPRMPMSAKQGGG